jgi:dihydropyrimidinase
MSPVISPYDYNKTRLMQYLQGGALQVVGSDNCTFSKEQKRLGKDSFIKIPNGCNGVEDRLAIVWTKGVTEGWLSPSDFVRVTSTAAAQIFGLYPKKGVIQVGSDADVVVWNGEGERILSAKTHHQAIDFNVFEGMKVTGIPEITICKGKVVWENNVLTCVPGSGKFIPREAFGLPYDRVKAFDRRRDYRKMVVKRDSCCD